MNKKGQTVGLGTVGNFLIGLLTLGLIAIALFSAFSTVKTSDIIKNVSATDTIINETITLNSTGGQPESTVGRSGVALTNVIVYNTSLGTEVLEVGNWSLTGAVFTNLTDSIYSGTTVNITADFTYSNGTINREKADLESTANNITSATTDFFANSKTLTTILFVVLLMGLLGLMIFVVRRFGGGGGGL